MNLMDAASPMRFMDTVKADLYRYGGGVSLRSFIKHYFFTPGFTYTFWMRSCVALRRQHALFRLFYYWCRIVLHCKGTRYGISIPYNTSIGPGLYIGHYGGIVLNDGAVLGRDCNINHGVTIGVTYGGKHPGVPIVGNRAFLGPGCTVIGGISLGDDVAIGANAVVTNSVPDRGVVVGNPGKQVSSNGSMNYVVNTRFGLDP
ncbi:MAG TPA: DapH/DapD/GlmU-related protein [Burkholderiales bacterium]|nr:DapH/DapD/GlmU-related protein [Burkholderiales bacterium]